MCDSTCEVCQVGKSRDNGLEVARGQGSKEVGSCCLMGMQFLFGTMSKLWRQVVVLAAHIVYVPNAAEVLHVRVVKMVNFMLCMLYQNKKHC